jgi:AraC family transcriptional regulator, regulatory protein of adaptative response / methylated-DNA-[protein]-cysteine methyltransferase
MATDFSTDASRWRALVARNRGADGAFLYGVRTTGIYCRPGCASRTPLERNVLFFLNAEQAEAAGYRPCKRCEPRSLSPERQQAALVEKACRRLESDAPPSLRELAQDAELSPWHFHRLFKRTLGVTPRQYAAAQRRKRLQAELAAGAPPSAAVYAAGFSSPSRAYAAAGASLRARGQIVRFSAAPCSLGFAVVGWTERGVCAVELCDDLANAPARLRARLPDSTLVASEAGELFSRVVASLDGDDDGSDLPLDIRGSAFEQRVWQALCEIPPGRTLSYSELAERVGQPRAARAVGSAVANNRLAVVIPCHRVVGADGKLGGYLWGVDRKRALLEREAKASRDPAPRARRTARRGTPSKQAPRRSRS